jgi:hypothetical protein
VKDQGILFLGWCRKDQFSYVRGKDNIVQVFDTLSETVVKQRQYDDLKHPIKGLHSIAGENYQHIMVDKEANCLVDDLKKKSDPTKFKAKGDHVHKTYFSQGELAVCSKGTTLQIWDVNKAAMVWQAKNVSNDELSL